MCVDNNLSDLNDYLTKFSLPLKLMQTANNLERISEELAIDLKNENVVYAEIRFAPMKHLENGLSLEEVIESVLRGLKKVNIKTNLILCLMRGMSFDINEKVIRLAKNYLNKGVCAVDLAGAESLFKTKDYEKLFLLAKNLNVPFTIHAGEADGPQSIIDALNFGAKRLGHGVRITEDEELLKRVIDNKIVLEVCPTSNINTNVFSSYKEHNIKKLYDLGVKVTVNTDNRTVSNITLTGEYIKLAEAFGFTVDDFINFNMNAIDASFISENDKNDLRKIFKNM